MDKDPSTSAIAQEYGTEPHTPGLPTSGSSTDASGAHNGVKVAAAPAIAGSSIQPQQQGQQQQQQDRPQMISSVSSSKRIPTYPSENIAQPTAAAGMGSGILNNHQRTDSSATIPPTRQTRLSLSYADTASPAAARRSENVSSSATYDSANLARGQSHSGHRRSKSGAGSVDGPMSAIKKSISLIKLPEPKPVDPMQEPRRSISKRPDELHLGDRDPHRLQDPESQKQKHPRRAVPFAAPYARSGVVLSQPATWKDWIVPGPLTFGYGQWWYLVFAQSFIAAIISGSINFGVAVALYRQQSDVRIWPFDKHTLAGDMGVTVIIQQIVSFIITSSLVHHDLYAGPIGPLRRPWPPLLHLPSTPSPEGSWLGVRMPEDVSTPLYMGRAEGKGAMSRRWWWFVRAVLTGSERNDLLAAGISWRQRLERLVWTAAQGFFLCVLTFWWFWSIAIAIVAPIYEHDNLAGGWVPEITKLLYGAIMSLLTNPIMALMAMGAESSVRRCYPELEMWIPFGGEEDFEQWKIEHGVNKEGGGDTVRGQGLDGVEESLETDTPANGVDSQEEGGSSSDSSQRDIATTTTTTAAAAVAGVSVAAEALHTEKAGVVETDQHHHLERRITEEPHPANADTTADLATEKQA